MKRVGKTLLREKIEKKKSRREEQESIKIPQKKKNKTICLSESGMYIQNINCYCLE